ncbi:RsmB/NOP family class I SAM-dependent RNA methyltransferase [uncultured Ferrovibrio sp.]|jgi:16S rRNA (cytosine967-C5)-methyltransferase|uniref:RsmB/NOP family class I SAM-dependent RNA methyltransferase n=1 Tax=uncultured Ferrovibrio sp. TaxID=1576913 RepID=UPI00260BBB45|nr:RsmB/NOP family class I SAM-dependent RNA methyltransferase [uncultured Ferrovibrio sp.]
MTPAARLAATIAIVSDILGRAAAADRVLSDWQRRNRYAGAKDRRAIGEAVYAVLREQGMRRWRLEEAGAAITPRLLVFADAATPLQEWQKLCTGEKYAPPPLSEDEAAILSHLPSDEAAPLWARVNLPPPVAEMVQAAFGPHTEMELSALNGRAPLDLRVNTLKTSREDVLQQLRAESIGAAPTPFSPLGIRIAERVRLETSPLYTDGLIEPQDEAAQLGGLLMDAKPGEVVVDLCAGAGGKTLLLAALMRNRGELHAADNDPRRLARLGPRLQRAGVRNVIVHPADRMPDLLQKLEGKADRVLLDVPCSGSGTWRRNPEARWRYDPASLEEVVRRQRGLLSDGARLVRPGGRLVYATCSILPTENDQQADWFLSHHAEFTELPLAQAFGGIITEQRIQSGTRLALTPYRHGTDGFFAVAFQRARQ